MRLRLRIVLPAILLLAAYWIFFGIQYAATRVEPQTRVLEERIDGAEKRVELATAIAQQAEQELKLLEESLVRSPSDGKGRRDTETQRRSTPNTRQQSRASAANVTRSTRQKQHSTKAEAKSPRSRAADKRIGRTVEDTTTDACPSAEVKRAIEAASSVYGKVFKRGLSSLDAYLAREFLHIWRQPSPVQARAGKTGRDSKGAHSARVFCGVYTHSKNFHRQQALVDTWLPRCDTGVFFTNGHHAEASTAVRERSVTLTVPGGESYNNMWRKVVQIWRHIHTTYVQSNTHQWFYLGGDDVFLMVENLRKLLAEPAMSSGDKVYAGLPAKYRGKESDTFGFGGPGYLLSKGAVEALMEAFESRSHGCDVTRVVYTEDVQIGSCLRSVDIHIRNTSDPFGRERMHTLSPSEMLTFCSRTNTKRAWLSKLGYNMRDGFNRVSPYSVAFHYLRPEAIVALDAIVYDPAAAWWNLSIGVQEERMQRYFSPNLDPLPLPSA